MTQDFQFIRNKNMDLTDSFKALYLYKTINASCVSSCLYECGADKNCLCATLSNSDHVCTLYNSIFCLYLDTVTFNSNDLYQKVTVAGGELISFYS
jgi:hypothetical protein